jgi:Xaa-Pro aminopeptidase
VPNFLFFGDTERSPTMRHELPVGIGDPFVLAVVDGELHVMVSDLDRSRVEAAVPGARVLGFKELGLFELLDQGLRHHELDLELSSRAVAAIGIREAIADPEMPVFIADRFRADGIVLHLDHAAVAARRRVKTAAEMAGIRRAQSAAEAGLRAAAEVLRRTAVGGEGLVADGDVLTSNRVRAAIRAACQEHGAPAPTDLIVSSAWEGGGHEPGSGPLPANLPIVIDLWPRDEESGCYADMTRTFVVGEVPAAVRELEVLVRTALERARAAVRPGVTGETLYAIACDVFEGAGHRTCARVRTRTRTRASSSRSAMASGLPCTRRPAWGRSAATSSCPATKSRSSRASPSPASARCARRTCCSSPRTAARRSPATRTT